MSSEAQRKDLLSQLFVVLLIGLAYQEMIEPVRNTIRSQGVTFSLLALSATFFLTSLRFFIGAQLHLVDKSITRPRTPIWIIDFMVIIFEMILFIFLGGLTSMEANQNAHFNFLQILMAIYAIDILWVLNQYLLGWIVPSLAREQIPWQWAVINLAALLFLSPIFVFRIGAFSDLGLAIMLLVNVVAFVVDVFVVDVFYVVKEPKTPIVIT